MKANMVRQFGVPWEEAYGYSQAVRVGNRIYLAGQISHDEDGKITCEGDMRGQIRQAYANVRRLLAQYDVGMDAIVEEVLYVTDIETGMAARGELKDEIYENPVRPASTMVEIGRLAFPELMVELRCIAEIS